MNVDRLRYIDEARDLGAQSEHCSPWRFRRRQFGPAVLRIAREHASPSQLAYGDSKAEHNIRQPRPSSMQD